MMGIEAKKDYPFIIDGRAFTKDELGIKVIGRNVQVLDGSNAGRSLGGDMIRDVIGAYCNYTIQFDARIGKEESYYELFEILTDPVDFHTVSFPYNDKTLTQEMYCTASPDSLTKFSDVGRNFFSGLSITFVAKNPYKTP